MKGVVLFLSFCLAGCASSGGQQSSSTRLKERLNRIEMKLHEQEGDLRQVRGNLDDISVGLSRVSYGEAIDEESDAQQGLSPSDIQAALRKAGFYNGTLHGVVGPKKERPIKEFE